MDKTKQPDIITKVLHYILSCDTINLDEVLNTDKTMNQIAYDFIIKVLENHPYEIYYSQSEKAWRTYLRDETKPNKRKPVKRKSKENLENYLVNYYLEQCRKNDRQSITLREAYKEWLIFRRDYCSAKNKTIKENTYDWKKFFENSTLAEMPIAEITPVDLIRFFRKITKDRSFTYKRISGGRSVLNGIFTWAIEEGIIKHNPLLEVNFKSFSYKPVEEQVDNVFTEQDAITLLTYLQEIENEPYALAIQLFFYLFIRIGEMKALRWEDINWTERSIYLHTQALLDNELNDDLSFSRRKVVISNQMKGGTSRGYRKEYLTDEAIKILEKARKLNPTGEYLFEPEGKLMSTDRFNRRLKKYCEECGIKYRSSHKIRFYCASTAYDGKNLATISKLMGHSDISTTLHYLRNVDKDNDRMKAFEHLGLGAKSK